MTIEFIPANLWHSLNEWYQMGGTDFLNENLNKLGCQELSFEAVPSDEDVEYLAQENLEVRTCIQPLFDIQRLAPTNETA